MIFVPAYTDVRLNRPREDFLRITDVFASKLILYSVLGIAIYTFLSPYWLKLLASRSADNQFEAIAVNLFRVLAPGLLFVVILSLCESIFLSYGEFRLSGYAFQSHVIGAIVGIVFLTRYVGIYGAAIGATTGLFFALIIVYFWLRRKKLHFSLTFNFDDPEVRRINRDLLPVIFWSLAAQVILSVDRLFATQLEEGMVSSLTYATNLSFIIPIIFATSTYISIMPKLSELMSRKDLDSFSRMFNKSFQHLIAIVVPYSVLLIVLGDIVVQLLLQHGSFGARAAENTAAALRCYALGSIGYGLLIFNSGLYLSFFSSGNARVLVVISLALITAAAGLNLIFMKLFGYVGLAMATVMVSFIHFFVFLYLVKKSLGDHLKEKNQPFTLKIVFASLSMGGIVWLVKDFFMNIIKIQSFFPQLIFLGFLSVGGGILYISIAKILGIDMFAEIVKFFKELLEKLGNPVKVGGNGRTI